MSAEQTGAAAAAPVFAVQEPTEKESRMPMELRMQVRTEQKIDPRAVLFLGVLGAVLLYTKVEAVSGGPPECS